MWGKVRDLSNEVGLTEVLPPTSPLAPERGPLHKKLPANQTHKLSNSYLCSPVGCGFLQIAKGVDSTTNRPESQESALPTPATLSKVSFAS